MRKSKLVTPYCTTQPQGVCEWYALNTIWMLPEVKQYSNPGQKWGITWVKDLEVKVEVSQKTQCEVTGRIKVVTENDYWN